MFWNIRTLLDYKGYLEPGKIPKGVCVTGSCKRRYGDPLLVIHHYLPINTFSRMHSSIAMLLVAAREQRLCNIKIQYWLLHTQIWFNRKGGFIQ